MSDVDFAKRQKAKEFGVFAEKLAEDYYLKQGYEILCMNFRTRQGEIDVIAKKDNMLVFVEVKARTENSIATPAEFVTYKKQQKIILAAKAYLAKIKDNTSFVRFDVMEIIKKANDYKLNCIENAFDAF